MSDESTALVTQDVEQQLAEVQGILASVPDAEDDPTPRMLEAILAADDPSDWVKVFEGRSIKRSAGAKVRVQAIRKAPSSFKGLVPFFLIADIVYLDTGETDVMSISSVMSMVQLLVAHERGWLPLDVEVVQKAKPTRNGFFPIHLKALERPKPIEAKSSR